MKKIIFGKPSPKQEQFILAKTKHIAFGGARGGGKSWAVRWKAKMLALQYSGISILIVRRTYPELINNHINQLRSELYSVAKYNSTNKRFTFPNGSTISFTYCARDSDLDRLQGVEYDVIFIDEATQLSEFQIKSISACLRGVNPFPKRMYYTCNPGGQSHGYFKRIFIDKKYEDNENPNEYTFIQSLVTDNAALMEAQPEYIAQLDALPQKLKAAWRYGDWNVFEGMFFEEFKDCPERYDDRTYTHVIEPFDIPSGWNIYRSYDFGYAKPFSCAWWAVDYDGTIYRILELYGCTKEPNEGVKKTPDEQFAEISEIEHSHPWLKGKNIQGVADPSIWDGSRGVSIADTAAKYGIYFSPGNNDRIPGWLQVRYRFQFDENGYPRMYVFNNCKAFIRTIPLLMFSEHRVEDLDTSLEDHVADEVRYFCMSRPIKPVKAVKAEYALNDPLEFGYNNKRFSRIKKGR